MKVSVDVVVIGGGVVGLLTAYNLLSKGMKVQVVAGGIETPPASWAGGGILSPLFPWRYSDALIALTWDALNDYSVLQKELLSCTAVDIEVIQSGLLMSDVGDVELAIPWLERFALDYDISCSQDGRTTVYLPGVGQVRNPRILKALRFFLQNSGVLYHDRALLISQKCGSWHVKCESGEFEAPRVLVAAGAWSKELLKGLVDLKGIKPVKGEMLLFPKSVEAPSNIILASDGYVIPRKDGSMLVGSTLVECGFDQRPTESGYRYLKKVATRIWPRLTGIAPLAYWSGLRPGFHRDVPVLAETTDHEGLFIATGHYRNGLVSAPVSARLMAQLICGEKPEIDLSPYSLISSSPSP